MCIWKRTQQLQTTNTSCTSDADCHRASETTKRTIMTTQEERGKTRTKQRQQCERWQCVYQTRNDEGRGGRHRGQVGRLLQGRNRRLAVDAEVAGDFYLIIIMVILMIIIILHHGADDYNHMGMQGALQLSLHDGGY